MCSNCKSIIHISMPAFFIHLAGVSGFYFQSCHELDLLVEGRVDTVFYKAAEILWEVCCCCMLPDYLQCALYKNLYEK